MGRVQLADLSDVQVKELFIILCVEILAGMCCWLAGFQERRPLHVYIQWPRNVQLSLSTPSTFWWNVQVAKTQTNVLCSLCNIKTMLWIIASHNTHWESTPNTPVMQPCRLMQPSGRTATLAKCDAPWVPLAQFQGVFRSSQILNKKRTVAMELMNYS
jgi:hypothetical protein